MALVVDTGPLLAAGDPDDRDHALLDSAHEEIVVPSPVVVELEWITSSRTQPGSFDLFLESVGTASFVSSR